MEDIKENKNNENNQNNEQNDSGKILRKFEGNIKRLTAILGGNEKVLVGKKIPGDTISELVNQLLAEKKESLVKDIKLELTTILEKKVQLDRDIRTEEEKLKKVKEQKMKEFNDAVAKVFDKISDIDKLEKDYYSSIKVANVSEDKTSQDKSNKVD